MITFAKPNWLNKFLTSEDGSASIPFVIVFPVFFLFMGMIFENGMISARHVMLERGVDIAVRDVRIGRMPAPTPDSLRKRICEVAVIIPDCEQQLELEMVVRSPRSWSAIPEEVKCIDRGLAVQPKQTFTNGGNNELLFLRACARFDPVLPSAGIGKQIVENNSGSAAGGSYALVATAAFVIEPFRKGN